MYIQTNIKGNNVTHLLREDRREGKKIIKKTFANLSALEQDHIVILKEMLKGNDVILRDDVFEHIKIENVLPWGHVEAVLKTIKKIDLAKVIDPCPSPERNIILGLVASRVIQPESKLSTKNTWINPALARELKIEDADEQDIYKAMDWLVDNQLFIEKRLADRHLNENDFIFSDASSSNYEGRHKNDELGPLIHFGYSRDKKGGKRQVNYMLLTGEQGRPISIEAFPGNTSDAQILLPTFDKIKDAFGLKKVVLVADRGMITQESINILKQTNDVDYVSALRSTSIKDLIKKGYIERGLFDEQNLYEFTALDEYPGER
ncbi:MAG: IS1634 family transposase, partial [Deltaproteobacteria bacterium]|nr:IS1634 family transposase [Deltaproteobacteria bacterium]